MHKTYNFQILVWILLIRKHKKTKKKIIKRKEQKNILHVNACF